ncbi:MAG: hypothetical protein EOP54_04370 [Sphingobacteriales bacterium]|nr:MAG: hypothetical protein EOP54_04370 [Sphingobacteriales bacterium]
MLHQRGLMVALGIILLTYLLLPNHNLSSDSYGYATGIRSGADLFSPHHLLYNWVYYYLSLPVKALFPGVDILKLCTLFNTFFAVTSLYVLAKILELLGVSIVQRCLWILFAGFSFGIWRFSLENESYILSMCCSLAGSYYLLTYTIGKNNIRYLLMSGLLSMLAVLFHQIHMFWWLGLFAGILWRFRSFRLSFFYACTALLVPVLYILVFLNTQEEALSLRSFWTYILYDYYHGNAGQSFAARQYIMFVGVAVVRTFLQVYPYMILLLKQSWLYFIPLVAAFIWLLLLVRTWSQQKKPVRKKSISNDQSWLIKTHVLVLCLQLGFAFYSNGNAEFMVMTPVLLAICMAPKWTFSTPVFSGLVVTMWLWNLVYAAFPMYYYRLIDQKEQVNYMKQHPDARLISFTNLIRNQNEYLGGDNSRFYTDDKLSPELLASWVDSGYNIITDMPDDHKIMSRGSFSDKNLGDEVWQQYHLEKVHTTRTLYGDLHLYKVHARQAP